MVLSFLAFGGGLALWIHLIHGNPPFVLKKTSPGRSQPRSCKPLLIIRSVHRETNYWCRLRRHGSEHLGHPNTVAVCSAWQGLPLEHRHSTNAALL